MAKKPEKQKKTEPISVRIDEATANALEDIRQALGQVATVPVTTTALVETAIKDFIASRSHLLAKSRKKHP